MNWLRRMDEYERPWVGRVGLALGTVIWLFASVVGFAAGVGTGLAVSIAGAVFILGEVWSARSDERHAMLVAAWRLCWRIAAGAVVIVVGAVSSDGWTAAVAAMIGGWLILSGLLVPTLWWLQTRETAADGDGVGEEGRSPSERP